jgi:hypothetical protein
MLSIDQDDFAFVYSHSDFFEQITHYFLVCSSNIIPIQLTPFQETLVTLLN